MRAQLLLASFVLIASALFLASCGGGSNGSSPFVPVDPFMEADIDGAPWTAELTVFTQPSGGLTIQGLGDDGTRIYLQIEEYTGLGDYDIRANDTNTYASWYSGIDGNTYSTRITGSGTVVITSDDESELGKQIAGTFSFTANSVDPIDQVDVTNGAFVADALEVLQ